jgi:hypothetical protein
VKGTRRRTDGRRTSIEICQCIADGAAAGEFTVDDPAVAGKAVFDATARYHDPTHAARWSDPDVDAQFDAVCSLLLAGLGASARPGGPGS